MLPLRASSLLLALCLQVGAAPPVGEAAVPANQLVVSGNACGPTALLNAFRFGNEDWQRAASGIRGETDKQRIYTIIREVGMRPSAHIQGRPRWSKKGVSIADLGDIGNELTRGHFLPLLEEEISFRGPGESSEKLLRRAHRRFSTSLKKGFPPIVSLRRYVIRGGQWVVLDAHFVTITVASERLEKHAVSFPVTYIDPWGGAICQGSIAIPTRPILAVTAVDSPCLEAVFPKASVGKKLVRKGESHALALGGVLGRW